MEVLQMVARIGGLTIEVVENYLLRAGWTKGTTPNLNAIIYEGPLWDNQGRPLTVILPARRSQPDASRRLNEVIRTVAAIESKSPESLVQAIAKSRVRRRGVAGKARYKVIARPNPRILAKSEASSALLPVPAGCLRLPRRTPSSIVSSTSSSSNFSSQPTHRRRSQTPHPIITRVGIVIASVKFKT